MGTKCNTIKIYDTNNQNVFDLPKLSHPDPVADSVVRPSSVYAIEVNPSRTLLATVGQLGRDPAIYRLPKLDPLCLGNKSHKNNILCLCWLDDDFIVSGGIDGKMAIWRMDDFPRKPSILNSLNENDEDNDLLPAITPLRIKICLAADKVRSIVYNNRDSKIIALSSDSNLHFWDPSSFAQLKTFKMLNAMQGFCLAQKEDDSLYAMGSNTHFSLLDPRSMNGSVKQVGLSFMKYITLVRHYSVRFFEILIQFLFS